MTKLITASDISGAWISGLRHLATTARQENDLIVEVSSPIVTNADLAAIELLDALLADRGWQDTRRVANTIFPQALAEGSANRQGLYARYQRMLPRLKKATAKNHRGIYFERLIAYPLQGDPLRANQIETMIQGLAAARERGGLHHAYEMQIFCPGKDLRPRGFPCLSSISLHVDGDSLRLSATYRNQYYIQKALGNLLGLTWLQAFIAAEAGLTIGPCVMHAFHAQIDPDVSGHDLGLLLDSLPE